MGSSKMLPSLRPDKEVPEAGKVGGEPADVEDSDDPMLDGEEEGDLLLGGGAAARDEDDFFLQGPRVGDRLAGLRSQVEEVTGVMKGNIGAVLNRGNNLSDLQDRSERLNTSSDLFRSEASRLRRNASDLRLRVGLGVELVVVVVVIIIISTL